MRTGMLTKMLTKYLWTYYVSNLTLRAYWYYVSFPLEIIDPKFVIYGRSLNVGRKCTRNVGRRLTVLKFRIRFKFIQSSSPIQSPNVIFYIKNLILLKSKECFQEIKVINWVCLWSVLIYNESTFIKVHSFLEQIMTTIIWDWLEIELYSKKKL